MEGEVDVVFYIEREQGEVELDVRLSYLYEPPSYGPIDGSVPGGVECYILSCIDNDGNDWVDDLTSREIELIVNEAVDKVFDDCQKG